MLDVAAASGVFGVTVLPGDGSHAAIRTDVSTQASTEPRVRVAIPAGFIRMTVVTIPSN